MAKQTKAAPTTNIFGAAPVITIATAQSKSKAVEVNIKGLQNLTCLRAVIAALEAVAVEEDRLVKEQMDDHFPAAGHKLLRQPENFKGVEGIASASCQLRANSSALTPDNITLCNTHKIEVEVDTKVAETFIFEPTYANDPAFLLKMETLLGPQLLALQDERGPIVKKQEGSSKTKITEAGRNAIFTKSIDVIRELMPIAFTKAVRVKLETGGDLKPAIDVVEKLLGTPIWKDIAAEAAKDASALSKKTKERKKTTASAEAA
jgi:hypothetical protein